MHLELFGLVRTRGDAFGCVRRCLDAFGCDRTCPEVFGNFEENRIFSVIVKRFGTVSDVFSDVSGCGWTKLMFQKMLSKVTKAVTDVAFVAVVVVVVVILVVVVAVVDAVVVVEIECSQIHIGGSFGKIVA